VPPADRRTATPHEWLSRARGHLALARLPKPAEGFWADFAFHARQAAELAVKAVFQLHDAAFPFSHDLRELIDGLQSLGITVPPAVSQAARLTRYAVETRYPVVPSTVTEQDREDAVRVAAEVVNWASTIITQPSGL